MIISSIKLHCAVKHFGGRRQPHDQALKVVLPKGRVECTQLDRIVAKLNLVKSIGSIQLGELFCSSYF